MTNSVYMDPAVGGDGKTYDDSTNPETGMDAGGHRKRFIPVISSILDVARYVMQQASLASSYAQSALNAPGTSATTVSSITLPSAWPTDIAFTLGQMNKLFVKGQTLCLAYDGDPTKQVIGVLMTFVPATGIGSLRAQMAVGTGTYANWHVSLAAPIDSTLTGRVVTLENELLRLKSRGRLYARELR